MKYIVFFILIVSVNVNAKMQYTVCNPEDVVTETAAKASLKEHLATSPAFKNADTNGAPFVEITDDGNILACKTILISPNK